MKNTIKTKAMLRIAGIIAFVAVIGFAFVACEEPGDDLNGTWTGEDTEITFNNGNFEIKGFVKGTYSVNGDELTLTPTHFYEEGKWYSKSEIKAADPDVTDAELDEMFAVQKGKYSVDGNKLTLTLDGESEVLTKK